MPKATKKGSKPKGTTHIIFKDLDMSNLEQIRALNVALDADGDIDAAAALYKERYKREHPPNLRNYIARVVGRYCLGDIIFKKYATRRPCKKKVTDDQARRAAELFLEGPDGVSARYASVTQACSEHKGLKAIIKKTGVTPRHLWGRAREVNNKLKRKVFVKPLKKKKK